MDALEKPTQNLKPCQLCGGPPLVGHAVLHFKRWFVYCGTCNDGIAGFETRLGAENSWNWRPEQPDGEGAG